MKTTTLFAGSLVAASQFLSVLAAGPTRIQVVPDKVLRAASASMSPSEAPQEGAVLSQGCWTSIANMTLKMSSKVSSGSCRIKCESFKDEEYTLIGLQAQNCYCGNFMPPTDDQVDADECTFPCPQYPDEACGNGGSKKRYSIFNLGIDIDPPVYEPSETTTSSSTAAPTKSTSTATEGTQSSSAAPEATQTQDESDDGNDKKDSTNVTGIVAGSVVGVVAVAGAIGALWFFMRRRRNTEIEEEHRRNAAVNAFISGSKPPGSSGSISMTDSRLDPVLAHRRLSDGSIADNQDYSRKILRVTNA